MERHFRPEKKASAIPLDTSKLRLYCHRLNDGILILGNGGIKSSKKAQDHPETAPHFYLMNEVAKELNIRVRLGKIEIEGHIISGQLNIKIKE